MDVDFVLAAAIGAGWGGFVQPMLRFRFGPTVAWTSTAVALLAGIIVVNWRAILG